MQEHKSKGKIVDGYEIIATYKRAVDAHLAETILHSIGYNGFNYRTKER